MKNCNLIVGLALGVLMMVAWFLAHPEDWQRLFVFLPVTPESTESTTPESATPPKEIHEFALQTLARMRLVEPEQIDYQVDYIGEGGVAHGYFWERAKPDLKTAFYQVSEIISLPDGRIYCDEAKEYFPKELLQGCLTEQGYISETDRRPLKVGRSWKLMAGDPNGNCSDVKYAGNVTVRGWYVWDYFYVGREWMFAVTPTDQRKIFAQGYTRPFLLKGASKELERELIAADETHPVTLTLGQVEYYCEGAPVVTVATPTE